MKRVIIEVFRVLDVILLPLTVISSIWMKGIRTANMRNMPVSKWIFRRVGVLPLRDQYSDPLINPWKHLIRPLDEDRTNLSIDLNIDAQLELLNNFEFSTELESFPIARTKNQLEYYYLNPFFPCGDAEYLYSIIRHYKPLNILEIGCGNSTLMIENAITKNKTEDSRYLCKHVCIEPYNQPWLEKTKAEILRSKIEDIELNYFEKLKSGDVLFIDSSHIIRPQGDVLYEILEILPSLAEGVLIHVHDIYTPKDYPEEFVFNEMRLWNEQYLLEALLTKSKEFEIISSLNYLSVHYPKEFAKCCPVWAKNRDIIPSSFWLRKT